ncbi:MAG: PP2C family protein-serine/threonine phosphatase [Ignavibacteria bacterium]|nr:PP2C family protein-serine/threonine phosphatase [Ignavibacteria bacterium]
MKHFFKRLFGSLGAHRYTGAFAATLLCAALMAFVDTAFLAQEGSLLHNISLGFTALLKITIAALFGGLFATTFPILRESDDPQIISVAKPFAELKQGGMFVIVTTVAMLAVSLLVGDRLRLGDDILVRFGISVASLLFVAVIVRQLQWLDVLIQIRRTTFTAQFRIIALVIGILLVVMQVFSVVTKIDTTFGVVIGLAILGMLLLVSSSRISWISSFSRDQKWKAFGIASIALAISITFMVRQESNEQFVQFMENLLPGARNFSMFSSLISAIFFLRIAFSLGLALPTAAVVDRKINEVRSLAYLSRTISQVYDLERLLGIVTTMIRDVCGATSSWVELEDSESKTMKIASQLKISEQELQILYKDGVLRALLAQQGAQAMHFEALDEEPAFMPIYPYARDFAQSLIAVPLTLDNRRIGTLFAAHRDKFLFETEDISLLSAFANNISIAIENVRLFENSLEQERFKREMLLAREMQHKLLPKQQPELKKFDIAAYTSPAMEVGGDYYDYVKLKNGMNCVIIGDVSGKGISAAFYMAELKGVVLAVATESESPKDVLCRINTALKGNIERGSYIAMTAVAIDEEKSELIIARAGHTPIALSHNGKIHLLQPKGIGVALAEASKFRQFMEEIRVPMGYKDVCLLFTDGVNEAMNAQQEEFGMEPLHGVLMQKNPEARFVVGEVVRRVSEFSEGMPQHDDMTVIAIVAEAAPAPSELPTFNDRAENVVVVTG